MTLTWLSVGRSGQHFECVGAAIEALLSVYRETRALLTSLAPNHLPSFYLSELNLRAWGRGKTKPDRFVRLKVPLNKDFKINIFYPSIPIF